MQQQNDKEYTGDDDVDLDTISDGHKCCTDEVFMGLYK